MLCGGIAALCQPSPPLFGIDEAITVVHVCSKEEACINVDNNLFVKILPKTRKIPCRIMV